MTKEEAIVCLKGMKNYGRDTFTEQSDWQTSLDIAIKALEQEECEDCISRKEALKLFDDRFIELQKVHQKDKQYGVNWCINTLKDLPSVNPQKPKTGHWIRWYVQKEHDLYTENIPHCKCSECGKEYDAHSSQFIKYCHNCGCRMIDPPESEVKK